MKSCSGFLSLSAYTSRFSFCSPKYSWEMLQNTSQTIIMLKPLSASSSCSLHSADRLDLFVPKIRTALAQHRAFSVVGPSIWNSLPSSLRAELMTRFSSSASQSLKAFLFPGVSVLRAPLNSARGAMQI